MIIDAPPKPEEDQTISEPGPILVSIVLPCLNEEKTIGQVIAEAQRAFQQCQYGFEILVADNGSTDASAKIATDAGARVISVPAKGYGAALMGGFQKARGAIILFGDADLTYDFGQGPMLIEGMQRDNADMVIGSRMQGEIEKGAMPRLHRYLGTPVLTRLINLLFKGKISDCNSGFRAFRKDRLAHWQVRSQGMEFASELIVNCLKSGDRVLEIPITLRRDMRGRVPHLATWRDGMRHLLIILSRAPHGFAYSGIALLTISLLMAIPSILLGQIRIGRVGIFDYHTLIFSIVAGFLGAQAVAYGLILDSQSKTPMAINRRLLNLQEVTVLKIITALCLTIAGFAGYIVWTWWRHGFNNINYLHPSLSLLYITVVGGSFSVGLFIAQVHKRSWPDGR